MSDSPQEAKVWEWLTISNHLKFDLVPDLIFFLNLDKTVNPYNPWVLGILFDISVKNLTGRIARFIF